MILTDRHGRPFERPEPPPADATLEEKIAHMRRLWAYNDSVSDHANKTFTDAFRKGVMNMRGHGRKARRG